MQIFRYGRNGNAPASTISIKTYNHSNHDGCYACIETGFTSSGFLVLRERYRPTVRQRSMLIGQVAVNQAGFIGAGSLICARRPQKLRDRLTIRTWRYSRLLAADVFDFVCASACLVTSLASGECKT
jgi:hypothetical protein